METPKTVLDLVERFDAHRDVYTSPEYNEAQVRDEFIDPMFEAMGWDIHNRLGFAEQFKQVVHEDSIRIGGAAKAPDYSFRLGGRRIFFLEAKKPSVNLREDPSPAYQLRRYAWTAKLPVSILSDFEEFIVYDTRVKPVLGDKASTARVLYVPYAEYPERWGEMTALFSPGAIQKGALDKYVESTSKKRGTAEVDDAFLAEIEEWRDLLARNIALRNSGISQRELNYAVQTTIDRIVFLRICEDRAIEPYAQLMALQNGGDVYARLRVLYERADERYNSGLFHFHKERDRAGAPDTLTPKLQIDDKVLKAIIKRLYYPESPYEFSVLPAEILGQVYERFLGSVIRLTPGGQAKVEQKPEVRKAGGVYYTPSYIVDYIVKHTVGKLLEGKTPQEVAGVSETWRPSKTCRPLAILDPACGSGSFLLGAYQYLLDWHLEYYSKDTVKWSTGKEPRIYQDHRGVWRLVTAERKRILLANIYGVDIDAQAVEVTKLSLLLRVLEGENADTLQKQFTLFHERALPDLANNIKCGNSFIGPDFYQGKQLDAFDEEETYRINAFDWNAEFPQVMGKDKGIDKGIDKGLQPLVSRRVDKGIDKGLQPLVSRRVDKESQPISPASADKGLQPLVHESSDVWFVTFVTYCSRVSERMVQFGITNSEGKGLQPFVFTADEQIAVAETLFDIARRHGFAFIALNVLPDHVHAVLPALDEETLTERVRMLKVFSAQVVNQRRNAGKGAHVWAQKFNRSRVDDEDALNQICRYVYENHLKHQDRWGSKLLETWDKGLQPLVQRKCKIPTAWDDVTADPDKGTQALASASLDKGLQPLVHAERAPSCPPSVTPGGFDAVIGNPPYGLVFAKDDAPYLSSHYKTFASVQDGYVAFIEKAHDVLCSNGRFGYIIPSAWLGGPRYLAMREYLLRFRMDTVVLLPFDVFRDAYIDTLLLTTQKAGPDDPHRVITFEYPKRERIVQIDLDALPTKLVPQKDWDLSQDKKFVLDSGMLSLMDSLSRRCGTVLGSLVEMKRGVLFDKELLTEQRVSPTSHPYFEGSVYRFQTVMQTPHWVEFGAKMKEWPKEFRWFEGKRILLRRLVNRQRRLMATLVTETFITNKNLYSLLCREREEPEFVLGVLNSSLLSRIYLSRVSQATKDDFPQVTIKDILALPLRRVRFSDPGDARRHDKMVSLVRRMLDLHKRLQTAQTEHERGVLERQIAATDEEIDHLVYELYELTENEIAIVEESVRK